MNQQGFYNNNKKAKTSLRILGYAKGVKWWQKKMQCNSGLMLAWEQQWGGVQVRHRKYHILNKDICQPRRCVMHVYRYVWTNLHGIPLMCFVDKHALVPNLGSNQDFLNNFSLRDAIEAHSNLCPFPAVCSTFKCRSNVLPGDSDKLSAQADGQWDILHMWWKCYQNWPSVLLTINFMDLQNKDGRVLIGALICIHANQICKSHLLWCF